MADKLVEQVAQAIYERGTETPEEYKAITGNDKRLWKTDAPWDTNPNELAEHERDDYRSMARAALGAMSDSKSRYVTEYSFGHGDRELCLHLQFKGKGWGVYLGQGACALSVDTLRFDWEPMPSNRDEDFFREYRFATPEEGLATGIKAIGKMLEPDALNVTLLLAPVEKVVLLIDALNSAAEDFGVPPYEISASQIIEHKKSFLEKMEKKK